MKRFTILWVLVLAAAVAVVGTAHAGWVCDQAAYFEWRSPALNYHCFLEWLFEMGFTT